MGAGGHSPAAAGGARRAPAPTMPRSFFRHYLPGPRRLRAHRSLRLGLGALLHDPDLWHLNRRSVSGAVGVGLFVAWMPLPGQMLLAGLLALWLRVNLALAVVLVWVTNPVTMGPMFWAAWRLGRWLLGLDDVAMAFTPSIHWIIAEIARIWQPLLLGCLILGLASALAGFGLCRLLWRVHVIRGLVQRRRRPHNAGPRA